jgi:hypothetical protein
VVDETWLAWALADAADAHLDTGERHDVYIALGAGETLSAICVLTAVIARRRLALPADLVSEFTNWLDTYAGHAQEPFLRELIEHQAQPDSRADGVSGP